MTDDKLRDAIYNEFGMNLNPANPGRYWDQAADGIRRNFLAAHDAELTEKTRRRIEAAIADADVSRAAVEHDWPDCHKRGCQGSHPTADLAFSTLKSRMILAVRDELNYHKTTRADVSDDGDTDEENAAMTLAVLLNRYNVHHAGTFIKAARMIVEAYPTIVPSLVSPDSLTTKKGATE
jgi:hypothetical protein